MNTYTAYFRNDAGFSSHDIEARTPEAAFARRAHALSDDRHRRPRISVLRRDTPFNEIEIREG